MDKNTETQHLTWQELKDICNKIEEKHLSKVVRLWGEEKGGMIQNVQPLEEDYTDAGDEGWSPVSTYDSDDLDLENANILEKGTPILWVD